MRIILDWRRYYHVTRIMLLIIVVGLAVGTVSCNDSEKTYQLTISSTSGGSVTSPGEGIFTYAPGTLIELIATPDDGYEFKRWTGNMEDIAEPTSASTNITMNEDFSITAEFEDESGGPSPSQPY